jgi:hypothetical protein
MARHLMHPDPDAGPPPPLVDVLWLVVLVLAIGLMIGLAVQAD